MSSSSLLIAVNMAKQLCMRNLLKIKVHPTILVRHILSDPINNITSDVTAKPKFSKKNYYFFFKGGWAN